MVKKNRLYYKLAGLWLASFFIFQSCSSKSDGLIEITLADDFGSVSVEGVRPASENQLPSHFRLFITDESGELRTDQSAVIGTYSSQNNRITFIPTYALLKGKNYLARYNNGKNAIEKTFNIPRNSGTSSSSVHQVYPSIEVLPLNVLKFYIQFSDSMARGFAYDNIHFINAKGDTLKEVYLDLKEELWSPDMKRFTLLLDPGRIKRGLQSLEDLDYVFEQNGEYSLVINKNWHTADDQPMVTDFQKQFKTTGFSEVYDSYLEITNTPVRDTQQTLKLSSKNPNDYALLQRVIEVTDASGQQVAGTVLLGKHELSWEFTPAQAWKSTSYQVRIESIIEDLAGNNMINPFDVDNQNSKTVHDAPEYHTLNWQPKR